METHTSPKMGSGTKGFIAILVIIAIIVPVFLGYALIKGLPYSLPAPSQSSQSSTGGSGNMVVLPQGAGGAQQLNFSPATLSVASGTTVVFMDQDTSAPHNVYFLTVPNGATNPNGGGNPPVLMKGNSYNVTLTTPGTYTYECQFHPGWMQGTITVTG